MMGVVKTKMCKKRQSLEAETALNVWVWYILLHWCWQENAHVFPGASRTLPEGTTILLVPKDFPANLS